MRRYNVVSGILLILHIIDFALAAPVLVQEKGRARVDAAHRPEDVITVMGKRVTKELETVAEEYFKTWRKPVDSSGAHPSSISAPSEPDHGLTNVVQEPAPNSAPSTANPDHALVELSSPLPAVPPEHEIEGGSEHAGSDDHLHGPPSPALSEIGLNHEITEVHDTFQPNHNPRPSTDSNFDWDYWMNVEDPPPSKKPGFDLFGWLSLLDPLPRPPRPRPGSPELWKSMPSDPGRSDPGRSDPGPWNPRLNTKLDSHPNLMMALRPPPPLKFMRPKTESTEKLPPPPPEVEVVRGPSQSLDFEHHLDHQSLSTQGSRPVNLEYAIYAAKGKAKESGGLSSDSEQGFESDESWKF